MPQYQSRGFAYKSSRNPYNKQRKPRKVSRGQYIDPQRFIKEAKPAVASEYTPVNHFDDFALHETLKNNIKKMGYDVPTPVQDQTIPIGLQGEDIVGIADTGTGKTAAFMLPVLQKLINDKSNRALIIAPTRELAQQIEDAGRKMGRGTGLFSAMLIGGSAYGPQLRDLKARPQIVIGTPGRIKDHIDQGTLDLSYFNIAVLDEVDRMLDMGFVNDVTALLDSLAEERQSYFFSATLDRRVSGLIRTFSPDAITITTKTGDTTEQVHQNVIWFTDASQKMEKLHETLILPDIKKVIVFAETQRGVEKLEQSLSDRGFTVVSMHGRKSQGQRNRALRSFREGEASIMLATDVAARGIDVADISHVINFTQPQSYEDYVHRIGRTGRAGRIGYALTFVEGR